MSLLKFDAVVIRLLVFVFATAAGFTSIAERANDLPMAVESKMVKKHKCDLLSIRMINRSSSDIFIPVDFLRFSYWEIYQIEEEKDKASMHKLLSRIFKLGGRNLS